MRFVPIFALIGVLVCGGCGRPKPLEGTTPEGGLPPVTDQPVVMDTTGERDPIAVPEALRGGELTTWGAGYPKSLNYWLDANSFTAQVAGLMFEGLVGLHPTEDRPVGGLAQSWEISSDGMEFTFRLHPQARWSDGRPVTAGDLRFYYDTIMDPKNLTSPFRVGLSRLEPPEVVDDRTLRVRARQKHWASFWDAAELVALPRHVWEGKNFNDINFDFPVVSGPYRIKEVLANRAIILERRGDWWGRAVPFNAGKYNFDYIRFRFMDDRFKGLEAVKKGDFDMFPVYTAAIWAEQTRFPAVEKGWAVRQEIFNREPKGFQGFAMNLRRPAFQDLRVRKALAHLLNREQMLEKLMYNQYFLLNSYFPDLFPGNRNPDAPFLEYNPEKARALLAEAGWTVNGQGRLEKDGAPFRISFLYHGEPLPHLNIYMQDLQRVGIDASVEVVSQSTYSKRIDEHQFDMAWANWGAGRLRDPEGQWASKTADEVATMNIVGFKDARVDALIEQQKSELDLARRNDILRQIDGILVAEVPYVLLWQSDRTKLIYWNKFGTPPHVLNKFGREDAALVYWWFDPRKAEALARARKSGDSLPIPPAEVRFGE
jgi:microcin C transport system substrate-binding protein